MLESYKSIVTQYGEPIYKFDVDYTDEELFISQDVPQKYHVFSWAKCAGGVIVYGLYPRGWIANPPLRVLVAHLLKTNKPNE